MSVYNMQTVSTMGRQCLQWADSVYRLHGCFLLNLCEHAPRLTDDSWWLKDDSWRLTDRSRLVPDGAHGNGGGGAVNEQ